MAYRTSPAVSWMSSLIMIRMRWDSAVLTLTPRRAAACLVVFPSAMSCRTWCSRGVEAVQQRHRQIEPGDVGGELRDHPDRRVAVVRLALNPEPLALQERPNALAEDPVIIGQENP